MDGLPMEYTEGELNSYQRKALKRTRDTYAAAEVLSALVVEMAGNLPHMRDATAREINYSYPGVTSAGLAEGDEHLADALGHFQRGVASLKRAHQADLDALSADIDVGRPRTNVLRQFVETMTKRLTDDDGNWMLKFGR